VYDMETSETIGMWDEVNKKIIEFEEDEDED